MAKIINKEALPRLDFIKKDPRMAAIVTKLIPPQYTGNKRNAIDIPNIFEYGADSREMGQAINDSDAMFQMLPDLDLTKQILISSILAPKDYIHSELTFSSNLDATDAEVEASLLGVVEDYFTKNYKIKSKLPDMLADALFHRGSYPIAVIPENAIDAIINSPRRASLEDVADEFNRDGKALPLGILGVPRRKDAKQPKQMASLEALASPLPTKMRQFNESEWRLNDYTSVTDNFSILKMPALRDKLTQDRLHDILHARNYSLEARRSDTTEAIDRNLELSFYRRRQYTSNQVMQIKTNGQLDRDSVGHPLVMHFPSESVMVIHRPSAPKEHVAYFVLIDQYGNPVTKEDARDYYNQLGGAIGSGEDNSMVSSLLRNTITATNGVTGMANWGHDRIVDPTTTYASIIESDLRARLQAGIYGDAVEITRPTDIYRIMLARALAGQQTQLLCIPAELMTYIAFDYHENGTGRSLVDSSKILGSIRAMLLFSDTMAAINNSTPKTRLNIQLDPADNDPGETVSFLINEHAKTKQLSYPIGASNPMDIINYLQSSGVIINVTGNAGYPETKVDTEDYQSNRARPDTQLQDEMRKRHNQHFGLTPETVDLSMQGDLATTVVTSNILFAKRVLIYQTTFCEFIQEHIRQFTLNSGTLMCELRQIIESNKAKIGKLSNDLPLERYLIEFVNSIEVGLPQPDTTALDSQLKALETYKQGLDTAITAYIDAGFLDAMTLGDSSNSLDMVIAAIKAYYIRRFLRENNILPELADLVTFDEKNGPALNLLKTHQAHVDAIRKTLDGFIEHFVKTVTPAEEPTTTDTAAAANDTDPGADDLDAIPGDDTPPVPEEGDSTLPPDDINTTEEPPVAASDDTETPVAAEDATTKEDTEKEKDDTTEA